MVIISTRNTLLEQRAMSMDREQESFVSRRTILAAASAALAGMALTATSRPSEGR